MKNSSPLSTNTIVFLLVFLCAAFMSSVFVYKMTHKAPHTELANNAGVVFPEARDLQPFTLVSSNQQPFTQANLYQHWTLLYFGFSHCNSICPATLDLLAHTFAKLHSTYPTLQIVFVSLDPDRDTPDVLANYMQHFDSHFIGVSGPIKTIHAIQARFGIYSARDNAPDANYQLQHTSSILLIDPKGKWTGLFKNGLTPEQLASAFNEAVK